MKDAIDQKQDDEQPSDNQIISSQYCNTTVPTYRWWMRRQLPQTPLGSDGRCVSRGRHDVVSANDLQPALPSLKEVADFPDILRALPASKDGAAGGGTQISAGERRHIGCQGKRDYKIDLSDAS